MESENNTEDGSDWEYEYYDDETESLFITVEFPPTSVSGQAGYGRGGDRRGESFRSQANKQSHNPQSGRDNENQDSDDSDVETNENQHEEARLQILDLHSDNPLISRNGQVYTCTWGRTLGTDIVLSASGATKEVAEPLATYDGFDVVTTTRSRLIAKPVNLQPRKPEFSAEGPGETNTESEAVSGNSSHFQGPENRSDSILAPSAANSSRIEQTNDSLSRQESTKSRNRIFLDRFAEARRNRGQTDPIMVRSGTSMYEYTGGNASSGSIGQENDSGQVAPTPERFDSQPSDGPSSSGLGRGRGRGTRHRQGRGQTRSRA